MPAVFARSAVSEAEQVRSMTSEMMRVLQTAKILRVSGRGFLPHASFCLLCILYFYLLVQLLFVPARTQYLSVLVLVC